MKKQIACVGMLLVVFAAFLVFITGCHNPAASNPDETPPAGTFAINSGDGYTIVTSVTLTLDASDDSGSSGIQMMISNVDDFAGGNWENFSSTQAWALTAGDGSKTVFVKFKDAAANESDVSSDSILLDSTAPGPPGAPDLAVGNDTGVSSSDNITRQTTALTFSGSGGQGGATMKLYDTVGGLLGSAVANGAGDWSLNLDLGEGVYVLFARIVVVSLGMESPSSPTLAMTVDTTPPEVPGILKPAQGVNTGANKRPLFTWTIPADAAVFELQADDNSGFASVDYNWTDLSGSSYTPLSDMSASGSVPVGTRYYLRMRALDAAGNTGAWSSAGLLRYVNLGRFDNDFNGDGYSDAIVGARGYDKAYLYYGGSSMDATPDLAIAQAAGGDFGRSVASAGDVNGDGYSDVIIGQKGYNNGQGHTFIYLGGSSMDATEDITLTGEEERTDFGYSVASAGDVNGDGYSDVIVGAPLYYHGGYQAEQGRAYIYYGGASMNASADVTMIGAWEWRFGHSVASAGDVNGDSYSDVIVGEMYYDHPPGGGQGRACIFYGGASMNNSADLILTVTGEVVAFGSSVASAGDVNNDGYADAIVGSPGYNSA